MYPEGDAAKRFAALSTDRNFYTDQAELSARLTIPSLFPTGQNADGSKQSPQDLPAPYQNFGAYAVESLSSKFLTATFPPNTSFFRYEIKEKSLDEARAAGADDAEITQIRAEAAKALAFRERAVSKFFESSNMRVVTAEAFRHLIVGGNVLLYIPTDGTGGRLFPLTRYAVRRGPMGRVLEIIVRENFSYDGLPKVIRDMDTHASAPNSDTVRDESVAVYTRLQLDVDTSTFYKTQEAFGQTVPGSAGTLPEKNNPWIPLRFTTVEGEDYGRGYVETYRGSLNSLEVLRRAILENAAASARTLFMVRPNGATKVRNLAQAANGAYVTGDANDVSTLRVDKGPDMSVAANSADVLVNELSYAFLLNSAIQRSGERVTATEIRAMAQELEATQAGIWSTLAREMQLPIVKRIETILEKKGEITQLPKDVVEPTVIGGLAALGRDAETNKLRELMNDIGMAAQIKPDIVEYIDTSVIAESIVLNSGVPIEGLLKTPEQVAEERAAAQQQAQQQQMMDVASQAIPGVLETAAATGSMPGDVPQQ